MNRLAIIIIGCVGIAISLVAAIVLSQFPNIIQKQVAKQLVISNGTDSYNKFVDPGVPLQLSLHFFNITNPDDVLKGSKPIIDEKGPYVFTETRLKRDLSFSDDDDLVYYEEPKTYVFNEKESSGSLDDQFVHLNLPAMTVLAKSYTLKGSGEGTFIRSLFSQICQQFKEKMFLKHSVKELAFDGYKIDFIDTLNNILVKQGMPPGPTKFAYFYEKNATSDGNFTIYTGKSDISKVLSIESYNGADKMSFWVENSTCNDVVGTDGSGFAPNVKKTTRLNIFTTDLCRSFTLQEKQKTDVKGIETFRFIIPPEAFYGPEKNKDNKCFCIAVNQTDCSPNGILDISTCRQGAPIVASAPHFFQGDADIANSVEGLKKPSEDQDQTFLDVEPITGKCLRAAKRLMISARLRSIYSVEQGVPDAIVPLVWVEESFTITDSLADEFKSKVQSKAKTGAGLLIAALIVGMLTIVASLGLFFYSKFKAGNN